MRFTGKSERRRVSSPLPDLPIRQVMGNTHYLSQSALSEVSGLSTCAVARRATSRTPSRAVFPCGFHHAGFRRRDRLPQQGGGLCHPVPLRGGDARHHRGRPQASRHSARCDRRAPYLGPDPATPSACPLCRARWWTFARPHTLGRLPARLLPAGARPSRLFRRLFLQELRAGFAADRLRFFGDLAHLADPAAFAERLDQLRRTDWVVYAKPPFGGPEQVLAYLGRYTHRVAIANSRLISLADGKVSFSRKELAAEIWTGR